MKEDDDNVPVADEPTPQIPAPSIEQTTYEERGIDESTIIKK